MMSNMSLDAQVMTKSGVLFSPHISGIMSPSDSSQYSPYEKDEVGQILTLNIVANLLSSSSELRMRVSKLHEPWTLSCGMIVEILENNCQNIPSPAARATTAFLKLFDHRYAFQLRQDNRIIP